MSEQHQFLTVIDRDEAEQRFHAALDLRPLNAESVPLATALGRVLAHDIRSPVDVPSFDRSNVDGYAVCASDTFGATEQNPRTLSLLDQSIAPGSAPPAHVKPGQAISIATGGMLPRGADAVVMIEHTDAARGELLVRRAVTPGANIAFTGTDITAGELVLHGGEILTSRETGVLAAIGIAEVLVIRRPRVAILSTGDEIIAPGQPMLPGLVFDSNARIIADAVRELGGQPVELGIVYDNADDLRTRLKAALADCDIVLLSGGTSKGAGDLSYRVVSELDGPGVIAHGVALKPGKPICLAATNNKPVVVLPGFPTSAIFTFHEFVAPVIRRLAGLPPQSGNTITAQLAQKVISEIGRTEYLLVSLIANDVGQAASLPRNVGWALPTTRDVGWDQQRAPTRSVGRLAPAHQAPVVRGSPDPVLRSSPDPALLAWPMGKGSGSVTTFSKADGFFTIGRYEEIVEAGASVEVTLLGQGLVPADLVVIGSHCIGLDFLLAEMHRRGWKTKLLTVGSTAGLEAAKRGQCDLAGIHLLDPASGKYNEPFLTPNLVLIPGYARMQGIVYRPDDERFCGRTAEEAIAAAKIDPSCFMVNRNAGSGTRILIDRLLAGAQPPGYAIQPRNHNAVAAAVAQHRADWGICIQSVAAHAHLGFLPLAEERYDFVIPRSRHSRPAVQDFCSLLHEDETAIQLNRLALLT